MKHPSRFWYTAVVISTILAITWYSRPDRGGVNRCAQIFGLSEISDIGLVHRPFYSWHFIESPKFRFTITPTQYEKLKSILMNHGYSDWSKGSLDYGSVNIGGSPYDDYIFCTLKSPHSNYYWSYSAEDNLIYAITFTP
jgi:hypothetical protein